MSGPQACWGWRLQDRHDKVDLNHRRDVYAWASTIAMQERDRTYYSLSRAID